jgi:modification methylase
VALCVDGVVETLEQPSREIIGLPEAFPRPDELGEAKQRDPHYVAMALKRLENVKSFNPNTLESTPNLRRRARLPFGTLLEHGLLEPGATLFYGTDSDLTAIVQADGSIKFGDERGSIHQIARLIQPGPVNGWQVWYYQEESDGEKHPIDRLRQQLRKIINQNKEEK